MCGRCSTIFLLFCSAVFWPSCLRPLANGAPALPASPTGTVSVSDCYVGCKAEVTCKHWSYSLGDQMCTFHTIFHSTAEEGEANYDVVSGEKYCGSLTRKKKTH